MAIHKCSIVWDNEKHPIVHLAMTNKDMGVGDAAFLRSCVEFYQMSQAGANVQQLILERLANIEAMLKNGIVISGDGSPQPAGAGEDRTDDIFDDVLEQIE
jgi:hypothetical protein